MLTRRRRTRVSANTPDRYIAGWYWLSKEWLVNKGYSVQKIEKALTVKPVSYGDEKAEDMHCYKHRGEYLGVPIHWGHEKFGAATSKPLARYPVMHPARLPDPDHPKAPDGQREFLNGLVKKVESGVPALLAKAGTGTGKTTTSLALAGILQRSVLVIVPTDELVRQWKKEAVTHLGLDESDIGTVQQDVCDYKKKVVVASLKSIWSHNYEPGMYRYHGVVVMDEVHTFSAQQLFKVFGRFTCATLVGMTATPKRKDGRDKVLKLWFGEPSVVSSAVPMPAYVVPQYIEHDSYIDAADRNILIYLLARMHWRNDLIFKRLWWLGEVQTGRTILVISDSIKQLQYFESRLLQRGVKQEAIGYMVDQLYTGLHRASVKMQETLPEDTFTAMKADALWFTEHNEEVTIRTIKGNFSISGFTDKRIARSLIDDWFTHWEVSGAVESVEFKDVMRKVTTEHRANLKVDKRVRYVLGTYGAMKYGVDIPRLTDGIDATPRAEGEQSIGRIRRFLTGKFRPYWWTIIDKFANIQLDRINKARMKDYKGLRGVRIKKGSTL